MPSKRLGDDTPNREAETPCARPAYVRLRVVFYNAR
jgi:hypothetical protein